MAEESSLGLATVEREGYFALKACCRERERGELLLQYINAPAWHSLVPTAAAALSSPHPHVGQEIQSQSDYVTISIQ